jgi:hypothetical protein
LAPTINWSTAEAAIRAAPATKRCCNPNDCGYTLWLA